MRRFWAFISPYRRRLALAALAVLAFAASQIAIPLMPAVRVRAVFPGFIEPCHPTLREEAPSGTRWIHEIKFDGYRTQAHLRSGRPAMYNPLRMSPTPLRLSVSSS
jgi:ATP-dependent DNA ligase